MSEKKSAVYAVDTEWNIKSHESDLSNVMTADQCKFIGTEPECKDFIKKHKLRTKVFETLGTVSMCWSETPKGIFDSTLAEKLGNELMGFIEEYASQSTLSPALSEKTEYPELRKELSRLVELQSKNFLTNEADNLIKELQLVLGNPSPALQDVVKEFSEEEIESAKVVRDEIIKGNIDDLKSVYIAGEICMWDSIYNQTKKPIINNNCDRCYGTGEISSGGSFGGTRTVRICQKCNGTGKGN